jgi:hypothetical protein
VRIEYKLDDLGERVRCLAGVEVGIVKTEVTANKVIPISQLYNMEPEKSHATEELVGYPTLSIVLKNITG